MTNILLHSGILNVTLWAIVAALVVLLFTRRTNNHSVPDLSRSRSFLAVLILGALATLAFALYKGHVLPKDIMQDIVSAQELLAGRSLYPNEKEMSQRIQETLDREPEPFSPSHWWPALRQKEIEAREEARTLPWVQAHPPFMTLFFAPFVACLNVGATYAAISLLSLGALFFTLALLRAGLKLELSRSQTLGLAALVLGWAPIANVLRTGQMGLVLGALMVVAWVCLKRGRPIVAGIAIAVATCLKLYPGLLLVYLFVRHRRAFAASMVTMAVILTGTGLIAGFDAFREHYETARGVVEQYAGYGNNLSLLGVVTRCIGERIHNLAVARGIFLCLALVLVGGASWLVFDRSSGNNTGEKDLDLEFALFVSLMPLLSPITWDHYLVVLLLPLAVVGRQALRSRSWRKAAGFLALVVILTIPDTTFIWLSPIASHQLGLFWDALLQTLRPSVLVALSVSLAWLIRHEQTNTSPAIKDAHLGDSVNVNKGEPAGAVL
jgi:hypothetical protein